MASVHSGEEILPKALTPWVGAPTLQSDRQSTDRRISGSKD